MIQRSFCWYTGILVLECAGLQEKEACSEASRENSCERNVVVHVAPREKPKGDQDGDGDKDFADIMMARMKASGMSDKEAKAKVKNKKYNEGMIDEETAEQKRKKFYDR